MTSQNKDLIGSENVLCKNFHFTGGSAGIRTRHYSHGQREAASVIGTGQIE